MSNDNAPEREPKVGGPVDPEDNLYISRQVDAEFIALLKAREFVNLITSRQMGKTSMVYRAVAELAPLGYRFAYFDLAKLRSEPDSRRYFRSLIDDLARDVMPGFDLGPFWARGTDKANGQIVVDFFRMVLVAVPAPVVVVLDEIDSTLGSAQLGFTDDLFTAIRGIYTSRPREPSFKRLSFCLVGVATPNELIKARRTTPYNIGRTLWLEDFDPAHDDLSALTRMLGRDAELANGLLARVLHWTGGQPYLTMFLCDELRRARVTDASTVDALVEHTYASRESLRGDTHFEQVARFIGERPGAAAVSLDIYERILKGAVEADQPANPAYVNLKLSGLVKRDAGGVLVVRNPIYRRLFDLDWVRASRPQRALRRARKLNYFAVGLLVLGLIGGGLFYQAVDGLIRAKEVPIAKFRDCDLCPEMVVVPAGSFRMGSPVGERGRFDDEGPQHLVTIARAFAVGIYEVTFNEWDACVTTGGCKHKPSDSGWGRGRHPVINVSWEDAQEYIAWLSKMTGKAYRLLSEAEWEYAARGGTTTRYPWGDEPGTNMADFRDSGSRWSGKQTAPVGSFAANRFGLHDMSGNVWEWVEDLYRDGYQNAPEDGRPRTSEVGSQRVVRGGSWNDGSDSARVALRYKSEPASRSDVVGFRLARTL